MSGAALQIEELRCEYLVEPLAVDRPGPRLGWILSGGERGTRQVAYRILAARERERLKPGEADLWDSGRIESDCTNAVRYAGEELTSGLWIHWTVGVWTNAGGDEPCWSKPTRFRVGLLQPRDWEGCWVGHRDLSIRAPLLRKEFSLPGPVQEAYAHVCGIGNYVLHLNGSKVGDHVIDPGMTEFTERVLYSTYDVTELLQGGDNAVGMMLGEGNAAITVSDPGRYHNRARKYPGPYDSPRGILQLDIVLEDGTRRSIVSGTSWQSTSGPMINNHFFGGEDYDARLEEPGWDRPGFDDSGWQPVVEKDAPGRIVSQLMPPMRVIRVLSPAVSTRPRAGVFVYDLGQSIGGWWRVRVRGKAGTRLTIRGAETLDGNLFPEPLSEGSMISLNRRHGVGGFYHRECISYYILRGDGEEHYEPRFFFSGFRYIQIEVDPAAKLEVIDVAGCLVHSDLSEAGDFHCSLPLLNRIHNCAVWSLRDVLQSIPGSNPHSEKNGWTGDAHLWAEHAMHAFELAPLWLNWLEDVRLAQHRLGEGRVPCIVPDYRGDTRSAPPAWGSVYPIIVWYLYRYYGDEAAVERHFDGIREWCDYLTSTAENHIVSWGLGDHMAPAVDSDGKPTHTGNSPEILPITSTAYYHRCTSIVSELAGVIGRTEEAAIYGRLADEIRTSFNSAFYDEAIGLYRVEKMPEHYFPLQTCNFIALDFGLVPPEREATVLERVVADVMDTHGGHPATGILGVKSLVHALHRYGRHDVLHILATATDFPSWGYWIERGATTLWQDWTGGNSSKFVKEDGDHLGDLNHAMFGCIDEYFFNGLAGIGSPTHPGTKPAYGMVRIRPFAPHDVTEASAWVRTVRGPIRSAWRRSDRGLDLDLEIPPNVRAVVEIPCDGDSSQFLTESGRPVAIDGTSRPPGIDGVEALDSVVRLAVGAGKYAFQIGDLDS